MRVVSAEKLEQEQELRAMAEAAATEGEREKSVLALDLKDARQKLERLTQEHNALLAKNQNLMTQAQTANQKRAQVEEELKVKAHEVATYRTVEKQLSKQIDDIMEDKRQLEEACTKLKRSGYHHTHSLTSHKPVP